MIETFLNWLQDTPVGMAVGERWFPWLEAVHVVFLAAVFGAISMMDARLMGLASRHLRVTELARHLLPVTWVAFAGAVITGTLMFTGNAMSYSGNIPFLIKMALLLGAGLNMLFFHLVVWRGVEAWDTGKPVPAARAAGLVSLLLWCGIVAFGRWIGFV